MKIKVIIIDDPWKLLYEQLVIHYYTNMDFGWGGYEIIMTRGEKYR